MNRRKCLENIPDMHFSHVICIQSERDIHQGKFDAFWLKQQRFCENRSKENLRIPDFSHIHSQPAFDAQQIGLSHAERTPPPTPPNRPQPPKNDVFAALTNRTDFEGRVGLNIRGRNLMSCLNWVTHLVCRTIGAARGRAARGSPAV